jgi:quinol monooxygenase YgiN
VIYVIATITVQPGTQDRFLEHAKPFIAASRKERGCLAYDMHVSATDSTKIVTVEQYESEQAMVAHNTSDHLKAFIAAAGSLLAASPQLLAITPQKVESISL